MQENLFSILNPFIFIFSRLIHPPPHGANATDLNTFSECHSHTATRITKFGCNCDSFPCYQHNDQCDDFTSYLTTPLQSLLSTTTHVIVIK